MPPIRQVSRKVGRHGAFKGCNIINETPAFEYQAFTHRLDQLNSEMATHSFQYNGDKRHEMTPLMTATDNW